MMEHKPCSIESSAAESHITPIFSAGGGGGGTMKRSPSELAFQEFYDNLIHQPQPQHDLSDTQIADDFLHFPHKSRPEMMNGLISNANYQHQGVSECESETLVWPQNAMLLVDKQPNFNAPTLDSQSSICGNGSAASPTSAIDNPKIKRPGATATTASTVSSTEQSDDEAEAGPCEQSTTVDLSDLKRIRRMVSNRESARRSRKRKQAHMAELQWQVDKLLGEKETLSNQYLDATQQYRQADTNNRVLKSDVEALKAKVRLAEDIVARGSLTSSLNQLLQSHLSTVPQPISGSHHHLHHHQLANVSPTISVLGDGGSTASYAGSGTGSTIGLANAEIKNGLISDAVSSVSDIWH